MFIVFIIYFILADAHESHLFTAQFTFHIIQILHLEKLGNIPGKHLEIPGSCSTKTVATLPREELSLMILNNLRWVLTVMMMVMSWFCGIFQLGPLAEIFSIANLWHFVSRICAEPEFRFCWMRMRGSDTHYAKAPWRCKFNNFDKFSIFSNECFWWVED